MLTKYNLTKGAACLAEESHMPIYNEIFTHASAKTSPGGAGLNSARGAAYILKKNGTETRGVAYAGCVGNDEYGTIIAESCKSLNMKPILSIDAETATGSCACVIVGKERALCANLAASCKYPTSHLNENMSYLESANMVYATAFFITSNVEAMRQVGRYCAANDKPMAFNIAAPFLLFTNFDDVMDAIEHADYTFCNEDEASTFAEKQGFKPEDRAAAAKYMCTYKKANTKRNRVSIVTQGAEPVLVAIGQGEGVEPKFMEIAIPAIDKEKIVDTNGCGDSLVGGFLAAMHSGKSLEEALKEGIAVSGHVLCKDGCDFEGY